MYGYLRALKHKGINDIELCGLGHISVLCGKNNSGKTSILEALSAKETVAIGKKVTPEDAKWLEDLFKAEADKYQYNQRPHIDWFSKFIKEFIERKPIWYNDAIDNITKEINEGQKIFVGVGNRAAPIDYKKILNKYFENLIKDYKPVIIPPKRSLEYRAGISLQQPPAPDGIRATNRLFLLKNQNPKTHEYILFDKIYNYFREITGYYFNLTADSNNNVNLYFSRDNKEWLEGASCGLGLTDILLLITSAVDSEYSLLLIEEPENHLHPEIQKKFLHFLKGIKNKQFILSTHSNVFLDPYLVDKIFYVFFDKTVNISDKTSKSEILHNLGYSVADNLVADFTVLTEGPSDVPVLRTIFEWVGINSIYNIKFLPLCGDVMAQIDLSVIAEKSRTIALIDSDPGSSKARTRFQKNCEACGIVSHKLERYSIENYFTLDAIKKICEDIPSGLTEIDPHKKIDNQLGFSDKDKTIKAKNHKIIQQMSLKDIESTDLYEFCMHVKEQLEKAPSSAGLIIQEASPPMPREAEPIMASQSP